MKNGREYGVAIFQFHGEIIAHGVLGLDTATALNDTSFIQHAFGKRGLAAARGAKQGDVLDFVCLVYLHNDIDLSVNIFRLIGKKRVVPLFRPLK